MEWFWILGIALICYGIIPGIGAFLVRSRWRSFRGEVIRSSFFPIVTYRTLLELNEGIRNSTDEYRFFGTLEGVQEDNTIWLRSKNIALSADMTGQDLFLLPSGSPGVEEDLMEEHPSFTGDEIPTLIPWSRVSTLSEGTKVYIAGPLRRIGGRFMFHAVPPQKLLVVFYDGEDRHLLRRVIWNSRHRNEYWNPFTPVALGLGALAEMILTYYLLNTMHLRIPSILSIAATLVPILPFLPPGIFFFLLYRWLWGRARFLRAERDLLRLPLRYFPQSDLSQKIPLPNGETYVCSVQPEIPWEVLKGRGRIRGTILKKPISLHPLKSREWFYWFGILRQGDPYPDVSTDPMVENVVLPGHPDLLATGCEKRAYRLEMLSTLGFGLGFGVNLFIALRILALMVR
ncbi:MAG: hypothetical protein N2442_07200 [Spirochaetes bacterium]|nr:hypothetical protein [Spirochaetota bacterium]